MTTPLTPDALAAALVQHVTIERAAKALGVTRAWLYKRPDLRAVLLEYKASRPKRGASRKLGAHEVTLPVETLAALDARCAARAVKVGPKRATRSAVARDTLTAAVGRPLPPPEPASGGTQVWLDLGDAWHAIGRQLGTDDAHAIADVARALLRG